jgi:hypothetical protein
MLKTLRGWSRRALASRKAFPLLPVAKRKLGQRKTLLSLLFFFKHCYPSTSRKPMEQLSRHAKIHMKASAMHKSRCLQFAVNLHRKFAIRLFALNRTRTGLAAATNA